MKPSKQIKVLLADDHGILREGLLKLLESEQEIEVAGEASNGCEAVKLTRELRLDVVVMDIAVPQLNGLEATGHVIHELPERKVLILSAHSDDACVEGVIAFGGVGDLIKQTSAHFLSEAIKAAANGNSFCSSSIHKRRQQRHQKIPDRKGELKVKKQGLTSRETEVLQRIAEGEANKQIAASLGISIKTVEKHRQNLMDKLNIHETAGLTRYAISTGIIENRVQVTLTEAGN